MDLISRQAAIDVLHGYFDGMLETDTWSQCDVYGLSEILPSAQPELRCRDTAGGKVLSRMRYEAVACIG